MNERYAVDPDAPANWRELKLLLDQVGLQTGRFLARYPLDWDLFVKEHFADSSEMDKKRVMELLARRKNVSLGCSEEFKRHLDWAENAKKVKAKSPAAFHDLVSSAGNQAGLNVLQDVFYEPGKEWPSGIGAHIPMSATEYARHAAPLFELSAEVSLIDRFFRLRTENGHWDQKRRTVLESFLKLAGAFPKFQSLRLVLELPKTVSQGRFESTLEEDLGELLGNVKADHFSVEYKIMESVGHGRYLLSSYGGLQFDHGFTEDFRKSNHVHWLTLPELEPLLRTYIN